MLMQGRGSQGGVTGSGSQCTQQEPEQGSKFLTLPQPKPEPQSQPQPWVSAITTLEF